jgi:hypothetical protein
LQRRRSRADAKARQQQQLQQKETTPEPVAAAASGPSAPGALPPGQPDGSTVLAWLPGAQIHALLLSLSQLFPQAGCFDTAAWSALCAEVASAPRAKPLASVLCDRVCLALVQACEQLEGSVAGAACSTAVTSRWALNGCAHIIMDSVGSGADAGMAAIPAAPLPMGCDEARATVETLLAAFARQRAERLAPQLPQLDTMTTATANPPPGERGLDLQPSLLDRQRAARAAAPDEVRAARRHAVLARGALY